MSVTNKQETQSLSPVLHLCFVCYLPQVLPHASVDSEPNKTIERLNRALLQLCNKKLGSVMSVYGKTAPRNSGPEQSDPRLQALAKQLSQLDATSSKIGETLRSGA